MTKRVSPAVWPIVGHDRLGQFFVQALDNGRLPRCVLFVGPAGVGKVTAATWLVQRDLCTSTNERPCGSCPTCRQVLANQSSNLQLIDRGEERIGVQELRDLLHTYQLSAVSTERRWFIIADVERLTEAASTTLLKFLEELPPQVAVIMTTSQPDQLLSTIRSRASTYYWHLSTPDHLRQVRPADNQARSRAAGRPGWLQHAGAEDTERATTAASTFTTLRPSTSNKASGNQLAFEELVLRDALLHQLGATKRLLWGGRITINLPVDQLRRLLDHYLRRNELSPNIQPRLLYDDLHLV